MKPQDLDFNSWHELYEHILESKLNGQHKQSKELYKGLSDRHKVEYIDYILDTLFQVDPKLKDFQQIINYYGN